jgi:HEXXH motif-containing protein
MSVFRVARVSDALTASRRFAGALTARLCEEWDKIAPSSECAALATIPQQLAKTAPDSPWLWLWCSTTAKLMHYFDGSIVFAELAMVSRPDLLDADDVRLADLHRLAAVEVLVDDAVRRMRLDDCAVFRFASAITPPRSFSLGRLGMVIWGETTPGLSLVCERGQVRIESGSSRLEVDICGEIVDRQGSVMFWGGARVQLGTTTVELPLHDPTLTSPTWQDLPILTDRRDARLMAERLVRAHAWLERFDPSVAENCAALTGAVLPVRGGRAGTFGSASREEAIGLIFLPQTPAIDILAESLLHEASHQLLFRIDRAAPVLSQDDRVERFYSPWRQDARPLDMVLHGAFVFAGVAALYARCASENWPEVEPHDALGRSYRRIRQVERAIATVRRHGHLSRSGQVVALAIEADIKTVLADLAALGFQESQHAVIDAELAAHAARYSEYVV